MKVFTHGIVSAIYSYATLIFILPAAVLSSIAPAVIKEQMEKFQPRGMVPSQNSECILRTLDQLEPYCMEGILSVGESHKSKVAIELTICLMHDLDLESGSPLWECRNLGDDQTKIKRCISVLSKSSTWWTTYFGYLNNVETFCHMYSEPLKEKRLVKMYENMWDDVSGLMSLLSSLNRRNFAEEMDSQLKGLVNSFKSELERAEKDQLKFFEGKIKDLSKSLNNDLSGVRDNIDDMNTVYKNQLDKSVQEFDSHNSNLQNKIDSSLKELYQQLSDRAINENKRLLTNLEKENSMLNKQLKFLSKDIQEQMKIKLTEMDEFDKRFKAIHSEVIDSFSNFKRIDQALVDFDFKLIGALSTFKKGIRISTVFSIILAFTLSFFTPIRMKTTLIFSAFILGFYYGLQALHWV